MKTKGYEIAITFKPFIDPECAEHMEIIKQMAKAIDEAYEPVLTKTNEFLSALDYSTLSTYQKMLLVVLDGELKSEPQTEGESEQSKNTALLQFMHDAVGPTNRIKALAQMLTSLNPTQTKIVELIIQSANDINTELDSYYSRNKPKN